ncbi:P-loop NTPase fold protein [Kordia sp.]|uniref:P-loop NTPase fold protein n=1 Tax=Kordia sp. TaxID=1965332 RepID=UPI003D6B94C9
MAENLAKLVTRGDVLSATESIDLTNLIPSTKYDVLISGKLYPPKEIIREAGRFKGLDPSKYALNGGAPTNDYLVRMGFPIYDKDGKYLKGGTTGRVWKLGTRWGSGKPNFFDILIRENIVITFEKYTFSLGDLVAITDGHTVNGVARLNGNMQSITKSPYARLEEEFKKLEVDWGDWILVSDAIIYDLPKEEQFEYKLEAGIRQIQQEKVKQQVTELWFGKHYANPTNITYRAARITSVEDLFFGDPKIINASPQRKPSAIFGNGYSTHDYDFEPKLDVGILSKSFANLIRNLKNSPGQMLGVFGQWGRGKTYFMRQVEEELKLTHHKKANNEKKENQFYYLKFHAWKYQDTEGVWAYLYQSIMELYLTHKNDELRKHGKWFQRYIYYPLASKWNETRLLFRLNRIRNGMFNLSMFIVVSLLAVLIVIFYPNFLNDVKFWTAFLGTSISIQVLLFLNKAWKLGDKGKRLVKRYTHKPNFNKLLGVQAEIQEELKYILRAWMKTEFREEEGKSIEYLKNNQKRLLLFVDDIDRCQEERLIQVIDALRVMLEDDEILMRVIIVAAIDEDILERAIQWKYTNFLKNEKADRHHTLVKEYMDKLFISCLKLPPLYNDEKNEILDSYAQKIGVQDIKIEEDKDESSAERNNVNEPESADGYGLIRNNQEHRMARQENQEEKEINYAITVNELELLKEQAENITERVTPRQLRIFMYRYLLARNIGQHFNNYEKLDSDWCELIMEEIIKRRNNKSEDKKNDIESILEDFNISDKLKTSTNKIIEIVAPY